jgi:hypothetical protein
VGVVAGPAVAIDVVRRSNVFSVSSSLSIALRWWQDKIMMGAERKSAIISPETMKVTRLSAPHSAPVQAPM